VGNFLTSWKPVSFSRRTLLHGVCKIIGYIYIHIYVYVCVPVSVCARCVTVTECDLAGCLE